MDRKFHARGALRSGDRGWRVRAAVAAALWGSFAVPVTAQVAAQESSPAQARQSSPDEELQEVKITGSRLVRRDIQSNSPLVTVDRQQIDDSAFISIEEALNELPEFMAGGAGFGAAAVTSLTAAGDVAGGAGTGDMFDNSRLPENGGRVGTFTPGTASVNLRGLGANRSLTLIDGRRGVPTNASGVVDLNTIPQAAIASIEVITGGASAVYGADALAGVTNIKLRDNFEGLNVRARGGVNENGGDGKEWQLSTLMGIRVAERGHAMVGVEYSKREVALWRNRDFFRKAMTSPLASAGNYIFSYWPAYGPGAANTGCNADNTVCTTNSSNVTAGGGSFLNNVWTGNAPTQAAVNAVFFDRTCGPSINCVPPAGGPPGFGGFHFNADGTLFARASSVTAGPTGNTVTTYYGPQGFNGPLGGTPENPNEITCTYAPDSPNEVPGFSDYSCNPSLNRVDWDRWLTSPLERYSLFGNAKFHFNDRLSAFSTITFSSTETQTRREPAPATGSFTVAIPYHSDPNAKYLPSIAQVAQPGVYNVGDTLREFRAGGSRGTNCPDVGGCTMQQAFPVPPELMTLLNSRPDVVRGTIGGTPTAANPWNGETVCELRTIDFNANLPGHAVQVPASGARPAYMVVMDPNTGETFKICGPNSAWRLQQQLNFLPPRGTINTQRTFQFATGLEGDLGLSDWTWELYLSYGDARTNTNYVGLASTLNYSKILSAPNYGMGYREENTGTQKFLSCTSGLNPFSQGPVSQDCIDAISSNQIDRNAMTQTVYELNAQGRVIDLPAGEMRTALGVSHRKNKYTFTADSLRERDYVGDTSPGQFGVGFVDASVTAREVYGELLVPLLRDLPGIHRLEIELGGRWSRYSTGQEVPTYKALLSWEPVTWLRARGGYNRAERTPNIAELYTAPTTNAQLTSAPFDPCRTDVGIFVPNSNRAQNPDRAQLQALCAAHIDVWGGNGVSEFHANPDSFTTGGGAPTVVGNPDLKSEKGDTWTAGLVFTSPFEHVLARRLSATIDWYDVRIEDPIEVLGAQAILNACFNTAGENPGYSVDDPGGYCALVQRNPITGAILRVNTKYSNIGTLRVSGVDATMRWSAPMADLGLPKVPGMLSISVTANRLLNQTQPITAGGRSRDYVGLTGASKLRSNTSISYNWNAWGVTNRVALTWQYRNGTKVPILGTNDPDPNVIGYPTVSLFNASIGTQIGRFNASLNVSNLFNHKPDPAGYNINDHALGLGTFDPFGDTIGRRYAMNLSMDF